MPDVFSFFIAKISQRTFAYINFAFLFFIMGHPLAIIGSVAICTYANPIGRIGELKIASVGSQIEKLIGKIGSKYMLDF